MFGFFNLFLFIAVWAIIIFGTFGVGLLLLIPYWHLVFNNSELRAIKANDKLKSTLMGGESIVTQALQLRVYSLFLRRYIVAITNSRIILIKRSIFGGFSMSDYQWKDLREVRFSENIIPNFFGARLSFSVLKGEHLMIDGISSDVASELYSRAQSEEQQWEEKNRIRLMEQKRAASGGAVIQIDSPATGIGYDADNLKSNNQDSLFENLEKIKALYDSGLITDAEFNELKSKILSASVRGV